MLDLSLHEKIPSEIIQASRLIEEWAAKNGWKHWRINGIADRNLVEKLEDDLQKRDRLMEGLIGLDESDYGDD